MVQGQLALSLALFEAYLPEDPLTEAGLLEEHSALSAREAALRKGGLTETAPCTKSSPDRNPYHRPLPPHTVRADFLALGPMALCQPCTS